MIEELRVGGAFRVTGSGNYLNRIDIERVNAFKKRFLLTGYTIYRGRGRVGLCTLNKSIISGPTNWITNITVTTV